MVDLLHVVLYWRSGVIRSVSCLGRTRGPSEILVINKKRIGYSVSLARYPFISFSLSYISLWVWDFLKGRMHSYVPNSQLHNWYHFTFVNYNLACLMRFNRRWKNDWQKADVDMLSQPGCLQYRIQRVWHSQYIILRYVTRQTKFFKIHWRHSEQLCSSPHASNPSWRIFFWATVLKCPWASLCDKERPNTRQTI